MVSRRAEDDVFFREERDDDAMSCIVSLFNPMTYFRLILGTMTSMTRTCASFRYITFMDVLSGLICGILMAAFGIVFSYTIFDEAGLDEYVGAGGATQAVAVIVGGFFTSYFSDVGITISAPDLNPAVFFGNMAVTTRDTMLANVRARNATLPGIGQEAVFATVLASIIMSTMLLGAILYMIGLFRITRVLQMLPDTVLTGFMASIGYIVVLKGLRTSMPVDVWSGGAANPQWWYFTLPSVGFGMIMYIRMRYDIGPPALMIPLLIALPIAIFYIVVYTTGSDVDKMREAGWMTPLLSYNGPGIEGIYDASYGNGPLVDWDAVAACIPQWFLLWIVIVVDVLLKLAAVRKVLSTPGMRMEHEVMLIGKQNLVSGFFVGAPSYAQPVLSAVNYNIVRNKNTRAPGVIAILFNLVLWVVSYPAVNFLPRFWLSGLIFFSAWGFVIENLFDSARRLSWSEYFTVWLIVIVNAVAGLGWAILCGIVATALIFAIMYGRGGSIKSVNSGADIRSSVVRNPHDDKLLRHLGNTAVVIQLHRYLFFGSATQILELVQGLIDAQVDTRQVDRARYFIFDFADVEDMDSTAMHVFIEIIEKILYSNSKEEAEIARELADDIANALPQNSDDDVEAKPNRTKYKKKKQVEMDEEEHSSVKPEKMVVLFTGLSKKMRRNLNREGVIRALYDKEYQRIAVKIRASSDAEVEGIPVNAKRCFDSIDLGMEWVEERLLERAHLIRKRWLKFESFARIHSLARRRAQAEKFDSLMWSTEVSPAEMPKYIEKIEVPKGSTLWRAGDLNPQVYLLQSGRLTAYIDRFGVKSRSHSYRRGAFVNEDGVYIDAPVAHTVVAETDSVVLALSRENMRKLELEHPEVAVAIQANILKYTARMKVIVARAKNAVDFYRAARFSKKKQVVDVGNEVLEEGVSSPIRPSAGATRLTEDLKSLMDVSALSQGVRNGRRMALQFSRQLMSNMDSPATHQPIQVKSSLRSAAATSALAQSRSFYQIIRYEDLDERIKTDWSLFTGDASIVRSDDVCRVIPAMTTLEAREMVWVADFDDRGGISLFDLLDMLTTVWEGEFDEPEVVSSRGGDGGISSASVVTGATPEFSID